MDIAILSPLQTLPWPALPKLRVEPARRVVPLHAAIPFHSFGFMGAPNGLPTSGTLSATDGRGWFVANGQDAAQPFIEGGLSGAPAFLSDGRIMGMIVQRLPLETRQGFAIPAFALAKVWPLLARPYPGLSSFDADTAHLIFGRGRAADEYSSLTGKLKEVLDRLQQQGLMAVPGASGSGKSSLAKAGVAEHYRRQDWRRVDQNRRRRQVQTDADLGAAKGLRHSDEFTSFWGTHPSNSLSADSNFWPAEKRGYE
jgi:hypothetical protein